MTHNFSRETDSRNASPSSALPTPLARKPQLFQSLPCKAALASILAATAITVAAQTQPTAGNAASGAAIEEVIVTAQKREQNLQDVGIAVTAFSGEQISELGFASSTDITAEPTLCGSRSLRPGFSAAILSVSRSAMCFAVSALMLTSTITRDSSGLPKWTIQRCSPAFSAVAMTNRSRSHSRPR